MPRPTGEQIELPPDYKERLEALRAGLKLTWLDLAEMVGVSKRTLVRWATRRVPPRRGLGAVEQFHIAKNHADRVREIEVLASDPAAKARFLEKRGKA